MATGSVQSAAYSTGVPTVVPIGLLSELTRWERIGDIVVFTCSLTSESRTDSTSIGHGETIISGLPAPRNAKYIMGNTFVSGDRAYRMQLNTDGTITAYWDTVVIPKNGYAFIINLTFRNNSYSNRRIILPNESVAFLQSHFIEVKRWTFSLCFCTSGLIFFG